MKPLSRFDKFFVTLAAGLFAAMWAFRYLPLQRCEVHGKWLRRGNAISNSEFPNYMGEADCLSLVSGERNPYPGWAFQPTRFHFVRYCPACRKILALREGCGG